MNRPSTFFLVAAIIVVATVFFLGKWQTFSPAVQPEPTIPLSENHSDVSKEAENSVSGYLEPGIFSEVDEAILEKSILKEFLDNHAVERYRVVEVNSDILRSKIRDEFDNEIVLNLFEDFEIVSVPLQRIENTSGPRVGLASWIGRVKGDDLSAVYLTIDIDGTVRGVIRGPFGIYKIDPSGQPNSQIIWQKDPSVRAPVD